LSLGVGEGAAFLAQAAVQEDFAPAQDFQ